ncbi:hypothetical protein KIPB_015421, partial [Kipferlia bialata]
IVIYNGVLIDAGYSEKVVQLLDVLPMDLIGICLTHTHQDHIGGLDQYYGE